MRNIKYILTLVIISASFLFAQDKTEFRKLENKAFDVGERLTFDVNYGFVTAGIAEMSVPRLKKMIGRDVYHITFKVNSVSSFDPFFKVRDRYETFMDVEGLFPWRFEQHVREGNYSRDFSAFFDQRRNIAKTGNGTFDTPEYVNDIVSAFYITRTKDFSEFKKGDRVHLENFFEDKIFPLDVVFHGRERVTVAAGTFDCIIIEPLVVEGGLFKSEGDIVIWLTDDDLKIPVKVKTKVLIGSISAELTSYEGLAGELSSKK